MQRVRKNFKFKNRKFHQSLGLAFYGIGIAFSRERNFRIHVVIAALVIIAGILSHLSRIEWLIMVMTITLVLFAELVNTSLEYTVDLFTRKERMRAKLAKDVAAGAVLLCSLMAIVIGGLVFYNKWVVVFFGKRICG